jgi:hypothetical protein
MKIRMRQARGVPKSSMLGRELLLVDQNSQDIHLIPLEQIPPGSPFHFPAMEPFTILGIDPRASFTDTTETASSKAAAWFSGLPDTKEFAREQESLRKAASILGNRHSCTQYRSFARIYDKSRKRISRSRIERSFVKTIIGHAPGLRKRQTIKNMKSDGILSVSLLVSLVLLIVVLTVPVGGVTIFGYTLFAQTLIVAWGPFAIIPIVALAGLGGLGAYWYKKNEDVFLELQVYFRQVMDHMEAMAYAVEDIFLLHSFHLFQEDSSAFRINKTRIQQARDDFIFKFVERYVEEFVVRLSKMIQKYESDQRMSPEQFFMLLADHPGEVQQCFKHTFSELVIEKRTDLLQLEMDTIKGE